MKKPKLYQKGSVEPLLIMAILLVLLAIALAAFGWWSFSSYQTQKNEVDSITNAAVKEAVTAREEKLEADFLEREKLPFRQYKSSNTLGSIIVEFPKTWSVAVKEEESSSTPIQATFHPGAVRLDNPRSQSYALIMELRSGLYTKEIKSFESRVESGELTAEAITVSGADGLRFTGKIDREREGAIVVLPIRNNTLVLQTQSPAFIEDFNLIIEKLTFNP